MRKLFNSRIGAESRLLVWQRSNVMSLRANQTASALKHHQQADIVFCHYSTLKVMSQILCTKLDFLALNDLSCDDVPLRNYSLTRFSCITA